MILLLISCVIWTALGQDQTYQFHTEADMVKYLDTTFDQLDENHNGYLEMHELRGIYLFEDANGDGKLTLAEYQQAVPIPSAMAEQAFNYYDYTGKGYLPIDEIFNWYSSMDSNDDGLISKQEYVSYEIESVKKIYGPISQIGTGTK